MHRWESDDEKRDAMMRRLRVTELSTKGCNGIPSTYNRNSIISIPLFDGWANCEGSVKCRRSLFKTIVRVDRRVACWN
ncbi:hypothetical protein SCLCIDRAFT_1215078 [Scleroderma citrinum Foug A]|uniref:Uncharacterized protein n=1 Tax=Scleroderma citrinum Foug A TaxID=1036808 RepID=A0A0C3E384_9AGAM|nr:hypothetical protein SCLCIDRAFT_1215078 [Scleroderma citrinum Foug A]